MIGFITVFLAGLLAGEELVIRYGVHPAITALDGPSQIRARQRLINRLRILVPAIFLPTTVLAVIHGGPALWWAGVAALGVFILVTLLGTVPINQSVGAWQPDALPADWQTVIRRWQRLDVLRSSAAILAFGLLLAATA